MILANISSNLSDKIFFVIETKGQEKNQVSMVYVEGYLVGRGGETNKIYFTHFNPEGPFDFYRVFLPQIHLSIN